MSRLLPFALVLAAACDTPLSAPQGDPAALAFAVGGPSLTHEPLVEGGSAVLTVSSADPFETVYFAAGLRTGAGPCPGVLGGACLGIASPRLLGHVAADATGTARWTFTVPASFVAGDELVFQGAIPRGPGGVDSALTAPIVATVLLPGVDDDGDGYDSLVDCDDADPAVHPGATERCDGVDTDCDPSTGEDWLVTANGTVNYDEIATAVAFSPPGSVIDACPGIYEALMDFTVPLTINGIGAPGSVVLDASLTPGYAMQFEQAADGTVLHNLTIDGADGACALYVSADLTLDHVVISNSDVDGSPVCASSYGHLSIYDSVISNNTGVRSGGLELDCDAVIYRTSFLDNTSTSGLGGAMMMDSSTSLVQLVDSVVTGNVSVGGGGAIWTDYVNYSAGNEVLVVDSDFGAGADENLPADVHLDHSGADYRYYQAGSNFTCDASSCY